MSFGKNEKKYVQDIVSSDTIHRDNALKEEAYAEKFKKDWDHMLSENSKQRLEELENMAHKSISNKPRFRSTARDTYDRPLENLEFFGVSQHGRKTQKFD